MARYIAFLISFNVISSISYAQSYYNLANRDSLTARVWTLDDGLPVNTINFMVQDEDGYLWFTTYDGIVRFDGLEFVVFNHANTAEMPHNRATQIYRQEGVGIWISLEYGGVLLKTEEGFIHFDEKDGFSRSDVTQIIEDDQGRMFFITHDGLYVYEEGSFSRFFEGKDVQQNRIRFLFLDEDGSKWVATNNGLLHFSDSGRKEYYVSDNQQENQFFSVFRNHEGVLYTGSYNALYKVENGELIDPGFNISFKGNGVFRIFDYEKDTFFSSYEGLYKLHAGGIVKIQDPFRRDNEAYYLNYQDSENRLWLIGDRGSLSIYRQGELVQLTEFDQSGEEYYIGVFEDREKNIWISTSSKGLIRIKKSIVKTIGEDEGLSGDNILGLLEDSKGRLWVGTRGAGLNLIENGSIKHFRENVNITSDVVHSIAEDSSGNIWVGHYQKGLDRIDKNGITHFNLGDSFDINDVHAIFVSSIGEIWVGTYQGLVKFDPENGEHEIYDETNGLSGSKVRYITEAQDGSLWIGTLDGGVSQLKNGRFRSYTTKEGLSSDNIRSIYPDKDDEDVVWIGTENNGINRIKDDRISFANVRDGLSDYNIHWISEDEEGWLWMSSNKGIMRVNKAHFNDYLNGLANDFRVVTFGRKDGMRNPEGNGSFQEAGIKTNNGRFLFATQEGVAIFGIKELQEKPVSPKVIIRNVFAKGESFSSDSIIFNPNVDDFEVLVHAITFVNPEVTRFRYKLVNLKGEENQDWLEVGSNRRIQFSDINPGEYQVQVQATNNQGIWSEQTASVFVTITPKYYEQIWFYLLCAAGLGVLLIGGWRIRFNQLLARQEEMERTIETQVQQLREEKKEIELQKEIIEKQAENLEQSNQTKDKFFSIIAHDLRNPFQALMGYTDYLYSDFDNVERKELRESIRIIKDSSKTLLSLTENLLEWANLQTGKVKPEPVEFELIELIIQSAKVFEQTASQKKIDLICNSNDEMFIYADKNMIHTILRNLISNAIKFTPEGGKVTISTLQKENCCTVLVSDTGIGMSKEMQEEVLSLSSKTTREGTNNEAGTGLGLALCKEMVEMNNGALEIDSQQNRGTTISIVLPADRNR